MYKKFFIFILGFIIIFSPSLLVIEAGGLVPECNTTILPEHTEVISEHTEVIDGKTVTVPAKTVTVPLNYSDPCDFNMVITLINTVISFVLIDLATPIFALIIIYVAWLYLSDMGSSENVTKAKKILKNAVIGYVIALAAWLIVKTILSGFLFKGDTFLG